MKFKIALLLKLYYYSIVYEDYPWKPISNYGLYIVEDDGEVDSDFPSLDNRENIGKFGFHCLGLVEHSDAEKSVTSSNPDIGKPFEAATKKKLIGREFFIISFSTTGLF